MATSLCSSHNRPSFSYNFLLKELGVKYIRQLGMSHNSGPKTFQNYCYICLNWVYFQQIEYIFDTSFGLKLIPRWEQGLRKYSLILRGSLGEQKKWDKLPYALKGVRSSYHCIGSLKKNVLNHSFYRVNHRQFSIIYECFRGKLSPIWKMLQEKRSWEEIHNNAKEGLCSLWYFRIIYNCYSFFNLAFDGKVFSS